MRAFLLAVACLAAVSMDAAAQFAAFALPARFELTARPGQLVQEVIEIGNDESGPAELRVRTSDWTLRQNGGVEFQTDTLAPDSCRPWVRIERATIRVAAKGKRRFRFEVQVPPEAPDGLCRFAMLIESAGDVGLVSPSAAIQMPLQGRIGVIVYLRVGNAKPNLVFERFRFETVGGRQAVAAVFRNVGNAQGRPEGYFSGTDAKGVAADFTVAPLPILPGETRSIPAWPQENASGKPPVLTPPIKVRGLIEWEGGKQEVNTTVGP